MSGDRADRLSKRRRERSSPQEENKSNTSKSSNTDDSDNIDNESSTDNTVRDETDEDEKTVGPLRETAETQMMRLTNEQYRELHHVYNRLKADYEYEFDEEFELNRHYFPLLLKLALPKLRDLDAEDLRAELKEMD